MLNIHEYVKSNSMMLLAMKERKFIINVSLLSSYKVLYLKMS